MRLRELYTGTKETSRTVWRLILPIFMMLSMSLTSRGDTIRLSETAILVDDSLVCTTKEKIIELAYSQRVLKTELRIISDKLRDSDNLTNEQKAKLEIQEAILQDRVREIKKEKRKKWVWGTVGIIIGRTFINIR
jgi:hypothetical protein